MQNLFSKLPSLNSNAFAFGNFTNNLFSNRHLEIRRDVDVDVDIDSVVAFFAHLCHNFLLTHKSIGRVSTLPSSRFLACSLMLKLKQEATTIYYSNYPELTCLLLRYPLYTLGQIVLLQLHQEYLVRST